MLETVDPMSLEDMERVLKHLPEPKSIEVNLYNFDFSGVYTQATKIAEKLEIKLDEIGYRNVIDVNVSEPSKEKILRIYRYNRKKDSIETRMVDEYYPKFISFKKAEWFLDNLKIELDPFKVLVKSSRDIPDYINRMREEIKEAFVDYNIILTPFLY